MKRMSELKKTKDNNVSRKFEHSYEVCSCIQVSLGEILYSIEKRDAKTLKEIQELTDAGRHCKFCLCQEGDLGKVKKELYVEEIVNKLRKIGKI